MKRFISLMSVSVLALTMLAGCGGNPPAPAESTGAKETQPKQESVLEPDTAGTQVPESMADTESGAVSGVPVTFAQATDVCAEAPSEKVDGTVYGGELSTGAGYLAYVPDSANYGMRATAAPILIVYGDAAYTKESAKETAIASGLAEIADMEGGPVIFVNPAADSWSEADTDSFMAVKALFSDSSSSIYDHEGRAEVKEEEDGTITPGCYPGLSARIYVFAEGSGADFVYENLAPGVAAPSNYVGEVSLWRPAAAFLLNADSTKAVDMAGKQVDGYAYLKQDQERELPVVLVNGSTEVEEAFTGHNKTTTTMIVENPGAQSLSDVSREIIQGYTDVMEHWMVHDMGRGAFLQNIGSVKELGLIETVGYFESTTGTIKYYLFMPEDFESSEAGSLPLLFGFHGGGSSAENFTWSSGWANVASKKHFAYVAVEQHVSVEPAQIVELLTELESQYACIDHSRIYASGFSMGSIKSTACAYEYDDIFAAVNPTNAVAFGSYEATANGNIVPVFYNAGLNSFFNFMGMGEVAWGEDQQKGIAQLLKDNKVISSVDKYTYDPNANADAGVFSDAKQFDDFALTNVLNDGALADPWGYKADEIVKADSEIPGISSYMCRFNSADGNCYTVLTVSTYAGHEPLWIIAENAWEFMSKFSRNADGSLNVAQ